MAVRVGVNGFGRIGRSFYRALLARGDDAGVELVAVNDPFGDAHTMAFLLKHDSVGGVLPNEVKVSDGGFSVDGREVKKLEERDPAAIPWADNGVDVVIESTGLFTAREKAAGHLEGGAKRVVISAPSGDADVTLCIGVNDDVTVDDVNAAFAEAAGSPSYRGVLEYSDEPLVSADIVGNPSSCIFSARDTMVNGGRMVKVLGWYDNEWGYSNRLVDVVAFV